MTHLRIPRLGTAPDSPFPPIESALQEPDGLLAFGGGLEPERFLRAYRSGIFPWYTEGQPILWWSPGQRAVFRTDGVHLARRLQRRLRNSGWTVCADLAFARVVDGCATPRRDNEGTWITRGMRQAYLALHDLGHAHSIEAYDADGALAGGLIGLSSGQMFWGDSMFSLRPGASSLALAMLAQVLRGWDWPLIDSQIPNDHTRRLGVEIWTRPTYAAVLARQCALPGRPGLWTEAFGVLAASALSPCPATSS